MMSFSWLEWGLQLAVLILLGAAIPFAIRLERALREIRKDRAAMETSAQGLSEAAAAAESAILRLNALRPWPIGWKAWCAPAVRWPAMNRRRPRQRHARHVSRRAMLARCAVKRNAICSVPFPSVPERGPADVQTAPFALGNRCHGWLIPCKI
jgi:hypothetical protein